MFFGDMGGARQSAKVDNTKLYKVLGVEKDCSDSELKKAYRKLAMKHHPDKGGDTEIFQEIGRAYEVLANPETRRLYDQGGEEALDGSGHHDGMDIFDMFFGGGGGGQQRRRVQKTENAVNNIMIPLESIYTGLTKKLSVSRDIICGQCSGRGGPADKFKKCSSCDGRGIKVRVQRVGPMISQQQVPCYDCQQKGETIESKFKCKPCDGNGIVKEKKILEVYIPPGCEDGKKIVFEGESDQRPGCEPGDVIVQIQVKSHATFRREGCHLYITKDLSISDVLCGFQFDLKHLDNRKILVRGEPGTLVSAREPFLLLSNEGLPRGGNPNNRGDLIVECNILFPNEPLSPDKIAALRSILPPSKLSPCKYTGDDSSVYEQTLQPFDAARVRAANIDEEEEEERQYGNGAQNVQCATQ